VAARGAWANIVPQQAKTAALRAAIPSESRRESEKVIENLSIA
jgi:hypothetical protein